MKNLLFLISLCLLASFPSGAQDYHLPEKPVSKGYFNLTQFSFLIGETDYNSPVNSEMIPSVVNINGYRLSDRFSIGAGVGMTVVSYPVFPVFADFRVTLLNSDLSPVFALKGGYSFADNKKDIWGYNNNNTRNTGGGMINPEIGIKIPMTERADFMLTIGYWYQHLKSETKFDDSYHQTYTRKSDLNRLSFSIGFLFK